MGTFERFFFLCVLAWASFAFGCSRIPAMERPITVWNGCPELGGICKMMKPEVQAKAKELGAQEAAQDWIEVNIDDKTKVKLIKADSPNFKKYAGISFDDLGVIFKYIDTLKRKLTGQ